MKRLIRTIAFIAGAAGWVWGWITFSHGQRFVDGYRIYVLGALLIGSAASWLVGEAYSFITKEP